MKYLLIGYLGTNNLGDECMLRQFLSLFEEYPHITFIIDSHGIDYTSDRISTHHITLSGKDRWHGYDNLLRKVDGVIWVGGNCFTDYDGEGAVGLLVKAKRMGKRFYYVGVGTDRFTLLKRKVRAFLALHLADAILFRDNFSLNHAKAWFATSGKLTIGPDLGEVYLRNNTGGYSLEDSTIVVSWRELKKNINNQEEVLRQLSTCLLNLSVRYDKQLVIFNTDEYSDKVVHATLIDLLTRQGFENFVYYEDTTLEQKLEIVSKAFCVITARLHTAVAADIVSKPVYVYNYSQKIIEFARGRENVTVVSGNLAELSFNDDTLKQKSSVKPITTSDKAYRDFVDKYLLG
jgi:polysaccharide pyruvyl transferase WcaK-like protein